MESLAFNACSNSFMVDSGNEATDCKTSVCISNVMSTIFLNNIERCAFVCDIWYSCIYSVTSTSCICNYIIVLFRMLPEPYKKRNTQFYFQLSLRQFFFLYSLSRTCVSTVVLNRNHYPVHKRLSKTIWRQSPHAFSTQYILVRHKSQILIFRFLATALRRREMKWNMMK